MRVVIDARESGTSTGRYVDKLIEYLNGLRQELEVIVLTKSDRVDYIHDIAPRFRVLGSNYKEFTLSEQLGLAWQLYRLHPDLVHFSMTHQPILYFGKTVTTVHDLTTARFTNPSKKRLVFKFKQAVYKFVLRIAARKSKIVLTPSQYVKKDLVDYTNINPGKVMVTYEAADKITDKPVPVNSVSKSPFIMYVGRPLPHKNLYRLVEAFALLRKSHPDLKLVLAGKKDILSRRLEDEVRRQGIKGVVFTDFIDEGKLRWLYEHAQAYVFPSLSEGFGLPGLEAMRHGLPVVSSNATCLPEIYKKAALYFDPENTEDMASQINTLLTNKDLSRQLSKEGGILAARYSWQKMAEQTMAVYKSILKNRR